MRPIALKDYLRIVGMIAGCLGFLALILAMEWHRAENRSKIAGLVIFAGFSLLAIRPLIIYWPQSIDVESLTIVRGPKPAFRALAHEPFDQLAHAVERLEPLAQRKAAPDAKLCAPAAVPGPDRPVEIVVRSCLSHLYPGLPESIASVEYHRDRAACPP